LTVFVSLVRCADGRYYLGSTRTALERRIAEHNSGAFGGWTASRRPVELAFQQAFPSALEAIAAERQLKGWSRAKKEALMRGDFEALRALARSRTERAPGVPPHPSTGSG
jgi:putative endonuclease